MTKQEQINNIMDWFEFSKVHQAMKALNWKWDSSPTGVPEEPELRAGARRLLESVCKESKKIEGYAVIHSTGGFKATLDKYGDLYLEFVVAEWLSVSDLEGF